MLCICILDALRLVYGVNLKYLVHIALLMQQLIPSVQVLECAIFLYPVVVFSFDEFEARCFHDV